MRRERRSPVPGRFGPGTHPVPRRGIPCPVLQAQHPGDRLGHQRLIAHLIQLDQPHPITERPLQPGGGRITQLA